MYSGALLQFSFAFPWWHDRDHLFICMFSTYISLVEWLWSLAPFFDWIAFLLLKVKVKSLSHGQLFVTPWTVAYEAPQSMEFSRQEYWSGLPFPSPGDLPNPGIKPRSPALQADALLSEPPSFLHSLYIWIIVFYHMCLLQIFSPSLCFIFSFSWYCLS